MNVISSGRTATLSNTAHAMGRVVPLVAVIVLLGVLLGCATAPCSGDGPDHERACLECHRLAVVESQEDDPHVGSQMTLKERTDRCLRQRGISAAP